MRAAHPRLGSVRSSARPARSSVVVAEAVERRQLFTTLPSGFAETVVAADLGSPTAMDVLPDGRVLVTTQEGSLRVVKNGSLLAAPAVSLTVDSSGERGLIGVTHDPKFASNGYVYLYHTVLAAGSAAAYNEITRYTLSGDAAVAGSGVDILRLNNLSSATNHNGGAMHFGADGLMYVAVGENANPANSQTLNNLLGKILRIDVSRSAAGDGVNDAAKLVPSSNPFVGKTSGINGAIYALGFRNPFTFVVLPGTSSVYVNDVGQNTWEELDKLTAGGNYGWDRSEGFANPNPPSGLGTGTYQDPLLAYNHEGGPAGGGNGIVGGAYYTPPAGAANPFPSAYNGKYFYADLGHNFIRVFDPAKPGSRATPDTSTLFASNTVAVPVGMTLAADGSILYLARGAGGQLLRLTATPTAKPTITSQPAGQTVTQGKPATFAVTASGSGTLGYQWQRNNGSGGAFADIGGATGSTYTQSNTAAADTGAQFRVVVTNGAGSTTSNAATLTVTANRAPTGTLTVSSGLRNNNFDAGRAVSVAFAATDPEDGTEPASRFTYQVDYVTSLNSVSGGIVRPFVAATAGKSSATFTPATTGPYTLTDVRYRVTFTVVDAGGLSTTVVRDLAPNTTTVTLATNPSGLSLTVDGQPTTAPTSFASVVGFNRELIAPGTQTVGGTAYTFAAWSDGGAAQHTVATATTNQTYTARYTAGTTGGTVRLEAESLRLSGYAVETDANASGGRRIRLPASSVDGATGSATGTFTGAAGLYTIRAGYWDESDGEGTLSVRLGSSLAASWVTDQKTAASADADTTTKFTRTLGTFKLTSGQAVTLAGVVSRGEYARFDYVEFVPVATSAPVVLSGLTLARAGSAGPRDLMTLTPDGTNVIDQSRFGTALTVRAYMASGTAGSVRFAVNGQAVRTENYAPFVMGGDGPNGTFLPWSLTPGTYTITVTPYTGLNATGTAGLGQTIKVTIVAPTSTASPAATLATVQAADKHRRLSAWMAGDQA